LLSQNEEIKLMIISKDIFVVSHDKISNGSENERIKYPVLLGIRGKGSRPICRDKCALCSS